jgi:hypothetical protein
VLLGMFCAFACLLPSGQMQMNPTVTRDGVAIGTYVDDTVANQVAVLEADVGQPGLLFAGSWYTMPLSIPGVIDMAEYYPVDGPTSQVLPVPYERAYILQAFSWGDNLWDGTMRGGCTAADTATSCAAKYSAPTYTQERRMWCGALSWNPLAIVWYYATPANLGELLNIEALPCPRVVRGRMGRWRLPWPTHSRAFRSWWIRGR